MSRAHWAGGVWVVLCATASAGAAVIPNASGPSMVIGPDGLGLTAYYDAANGDLEVAHCADAACTSVTTVTVDSTGDVGRKAAMVMGASGPVISYEDTTNGALKLALCADAACTTSTRVTIAAGFDNTTTAVAIGSDGRPLVPFVASAIPFPRLKAAHCDDASCSAVTISDLANAMSGFAVGVAIGGDDRAMIFYAGSTLGQPAPGALLHCTDVACTTGSLNPVTALAPQDTGREPLIGPGIDFPSMRVGADGFLRIAYGYIYFEGSSVKVLRCLDAECFVFGTNIATIPGRFAAPSLALGPGDLPRIVVGASLDATRLDLVQCADADCATFEPTTCVNSVGARPSLDLDSAAAPLVAFEVGANVQVARPPVACGPVVTVADATAVEQPGPPTPSLRFKVTLTHANTQPSLISYSTAGYSAQSGIDYQATSGTLTFLPGQPLEQFVDVPVYDDSSDEPDETMTLGLSAPVNAGLERDRATGTIQDDDDATTRVSLRQDCAVVEGDVGPRECAMLVSLSEPSAQQVRVRYLTSDQSALGGVDYGAASGTLTFMPGALREYLRVTVVGDAAVEADETFLLELADPVNALAGDFQSTVTIVDDDAPSLSKLEVAHGTALTTDLAPDPGPSPDQDLYRVAQAPFASYEVVLDAVSGDALPGVRLERLAADGSTVLQSGTIVGTGAATQLRFLNLLAAPVDNQYVRVRGGSCGTACGPDDTYRLRMYDTTAVIPRYNNASEQTTVLILQNTTDQPIHAAATFWDTSGFVEHSMSMTIPPRGQYISNTVLVPELAEAIGSLTIAHDGAYGALAGKAVAVQPASGLAFDTPLVYRPR